MALNVKKKKFRSPKYRSHTYRCLEAEEVLNGRAFACLVCNTSPTHTQRKFSAK
jgi:hypothetical protein